MYISSCGAFSEHSPLSRFNLHAFAFCQSYHQWFTSGPNALALSDRMLLFDLLLSFFNSLLANTLHAWRRDDLLALEVMGFMCVSARKFDVVPTKLSMALRMTGTGSVSGHSNTCASRRYVIFPEISLITAVAGRLK